ncbi:PREDICTED: DNA polymerase theta-like [Ceratosolen solmsi marchali]|uniref:DNA-directed DNA polymerase n=1 Tax=Ceratosolen solmsi marchali TaxID=326594 RepID=A0AAJ6YMR6_9HYME|nr:PREDICTED: DNA polymerase theta-like [Ceratosolen solmsi marchali]
MLSKVTKKKRLKVSGKGRDSLMKEDGDINKRLKDYLSLLPDVLANDENQLLELPEMLLSDAEWCEINVSSKTLGIESKDDLLNSIVPRKQWVAGLSVNSDRTELENKNANNSTLAKSIKSLSSCKKNKSKLFDNITDTFTNSNILSVRELSDVNSQKRFELSSWGLPPSILQKYQARGINTMFLWQVECLANYKILEENKNLVYSAPTSAGKTLVSEFLILKTVLERRKKAIFILPFVSVVREKMFYFQDLLCDSGVRVEGFMGGVAPVGGFSAVHIAIATIEKANSLVNRLMENGDLKTLGVVVIDELHLIGDPNRGYLLELLLTKLRYMSLSIEHVNIQLIGMSATLPNLPIIAEWLDAELYKTDFRPIPLNEQCKIDKSIFDCKLNFIRELEAAPDIVNDIDNIVQLCIETISGGHGILIFCAAKSWCEKLATQIAFAFFQLGRDNTYHGQILRKMMDAVALQEVLIQLAHCPIGLDSILEKTVSFGVAFHHAGLTMDERDIIEGGFRLGSLKVLVATSTLSSGVNLPARRVIVRSLKFNGNLLDKLTYQQMIGRAGRMGKDTAGESILICQPNERASALNLMASSLEPILSCLESSAPLIRALLEAVASEIVRTPKDLDFYCKCTFVYKCEGAVVTTMVQEAVQFLIANEFLLQEERLVATCLGKACLSASIPPWDGLFLFEELQRARKCLVLDTELHVVYLVTPFSAGSQISQIDWMGFMELWKTLPESERRVGKLVGVEERFLMSALRGIIKPGKLLNIHRRFYTALALHDLVREVPLNTVCRKYNCCRGLLQSLQQSSSTFAGMVTNFCKELKWDCMELLFAQFQARLQFGVCRDLLDLLRLPSLNGLRARSLFKYGITSVAELAIASTLNVEEALNKALPFESEKNFDGEKMTEIVQRTKMRTVFITGKDGLTAREAAQIVVNEARVLVQNELGVRDVQWSQIDNASQASPRSNCVDSTNLTTPNMMNGPRSSQMAYVEVHAVADEAKDKKRLDNERTDIAVNDSGAADMENICRGKKRLSKSSDSLFALSGRSINDVDRMQMYSDENLSAGDSRSRFAKFSKLLPESCGESRNDRGDRHQMLSEMLVEKTSSGIIMESTNDDGKEVSKNSEVSLMFSEDLSNETAACKLIDETNDSGLVAKAIDKSNDDPSASFDDVINESDKPEIASRMLKSKLLEKTKSLLKEGQITIRSIDFQDRMDIITAMKSIENPTESEAKKSLGVSDRVLDDITSNAPMNEDKGIISVAAPMSETKVTRKETRISAVSSNNSSPSLFSDSSFFDPQMCSILEKNVIDSEFLADFEKSNFASQNVASNETETCKRITRSGGSIGNKKQSVGSNKAATPRDVSVDPIREQNNCNDARAEDLSTPRNNRETSNNTMKNAKQISDQLTWIEDSWDQIKNQRPIQDKYEMAKKNNKNEENSDSGSPSLLNKTNARGHLRQLISSQIALRTIQAKTTKDKSPDVTAKDTPKYIVRKRAYDRNNSDDSPIASVRTYNTRRPFMPHSLNKSDSEDSVINSQKMKPDETNFNKTRMRIERKLGKSLKSKQIGSSKALGSSRELLKQNVEPLSRCAQSNGNDTNCTDSRLMFESDDVVKSQGKMPRKIKEISMKDKMPLLNDNNHANAYNDKISLKATEPVNVANSRRAFRLFRSNIEGSSTNEQKHNLAVAIVTEMCAREPVVAIGNRIIGIEERRKDRKADAYIYRDKKIYGIVISWGAGNTYYMPFGNTQDTKITIKERINFLRDILTNPSRTLHCFDAKEVYKMLYVRYEIEFRCRFCDPNVADWIINSESWHKSYSELVIKKTYRDKRNLKTKAQYFPDSLDITNALDNSFGTNFLVSSARAAAKAVLAWYMTEAVLNAIKNQNPSLLSLYREVEMPTIIILANMELRGVGINMNSLQELSIAIKNDLSRIEEKAFNLAGRKFNFHSSKDVSQVLGLSKKGRGCTNKLALKSCENPISSLITLWRKLNTVQTKIIFPMLQVETKNNRVHGNCITYTSTGRVSMHEPNLQTIPRDFESEISNCVLSCRMAFVPDTGNVMLSADFCQLELRILAHYSQDPVLCKLLHEKGDIFKSIAARLNKTSENKVNDDMRQRAKQLCYAMIYGMGTKSLAETLSVTESEAKDYLEAFMGTYKGIRVWLNAVSVQAQKDGFVSTLANRRRILPDIASKIPAIKSHAERQAINTKVQGSAADITKKAMVLIENKLRDEFSCNLPLTLSTTQSTRKLRYSDTERRARSAHLVLQIHDELLYEVSRSDLDKVASIIKESMENAYKLRVPLPVKMKVGTAWGNLMDYEN